VKALRERHGMPVFKHACGNNWKLLDMFVEIGFACYQSIQASAGMDLARVKERYGSALCLWGGVQVEHLVSGTAADIRADVAAAMAAGKPGGGYIFGSSHSIAVGTKYDNFMTMIDAFLASAYY
jgi:uroporphyrinogen-III decarboxylase